MRLLQLASQALPIGGYSHSHGLEPAIEAGIVRDEKSLCAWIADVLAFCMIRFEVPQLMMMADAWSAQDLPSLRCLNHEYLATRESSELRAATVQMGYSLRALAAALPDLPESLHGFLKAVEEPSLPCVWSGIAQAWEIEPTDSAGAYLWSWTENQVLVAVKTVPLGQSAGQRVLLAIAERIACAVQALRPVQTVRPVQALRAADSAGRSNFAPGLAILSAGHETQYSRLFRS